MKPRPDLLVPLVYGAGLATGLAHFGAPACALAVLVAWLSRPPLARLLAGAATAGALAGLLARGHDAARSAARLAEGPAALVVRVVDPARDGGLGRVEPRDGRGAVDARWPPGLTVRAGAVVRVTGRWVPRAGALGRAGGTLVVRTAEVIGATPTPGDRLRNAATDAARRLYGPRAPLVEALVLGTRGEMDPALRDAFAYSGLVHLLSISGFHVGLLSVWVVLLLRLAGASTGRALAAGALVAIAYVSFLGWPAPAGRAAALGVLLATMYLRQRRVRADALLATSCLGVVLLDPWSVADLGGWLSAAALWGATTFTRWSDRAFGERYLTRTLASSVGATLATAPITAARLGAVAPIGIVLNLAAIPLAALAVPGVVASLLLAPVPALAAPLAAGAGLALNALELLARWGAAVPGGHLVLPAALTAALPWVAALAAGLWAIGRRNHPRVALRRALVAATAGIWLSAGHAIGTRAGASGRGLELDFLDVGQGDAIAIRTPGGRWVLVDAGPRSDHGDAGRRVVAPFLARRGASRLAVLVVSHAHLDHLGGAAAVLEREGAELIIEPAELVDDPVYRDFLDRVAARGIPWRPARPGLSFVVDSVRFTVLHPDTAWADWGADLNEDSAVLLVEYGAFSAVLAGDAGVPAEARLRGHVGRVDLLKVGHHGSRGATGDAWLDELRPAAAVVSVGRGNRYGHPSPEALGRLARHGVEVWRTDREGTVTVTTDGHRMTVTGRRGRTEHSVE